MHAAGMQTIPDVHEHLNSTFTLALHPGRETETHANTSVLNTENSLSAARCTMKSRFAPTLSIYNLLKTAVTAMISIIPAMLSV